MPRSAMLTADDARSCHRRRRRVTGLRHRRFGVETPGREGRGGKSAWTPGSRPSHLEAVRETHPLAWSGTDARALRGSPTLTRLDAMVMLVEDANRRRPSAHGPGLGASRRRRDVGARDDIESRFLPRDGRWDSDDDGDDGGDEWWPDRRHPAPATATTSSKRSAGSTPRASTTDAATIPGAFVALVPWADALNHSPDADGRSLLVDEGRRNERDE